MTAVTYAGLAPVPWEHLGELKTLAEEHKEPLWIAAGAFAYGVAMGKRMERARRKKNKEQSKTV